MRLLLPVSVVLVMLFLFEIGLAPVLFVLFCAASAIGLVFYTDLLALESALKSILLIRPGARRKRLGNGKALSCAAKRVLSCIPLIERRLLSANSQDERN